MGLDFDVREFCQNLRATKPPYECPVKDCGKVYKSFAGIQFHLFNFNHETPGSLASSQEPLEALTFAEAQKIVEIEMGGKMQRLGIFDTIPLISKEEFEILYPAAPESSQTVINEAVKTPSTKSAALKNIHKKTPKLSATPITAIELMNRKETIPEKPAVFKLPEAVYSILENYDLPDAPERAKSYYRFIEKTPEELEDEVEYDMDEEDFTWLELINQRRKFEGLTEVSPESFELLMDRLEKESYFLMQSSGKDQGPPIDEDAVCCICMDGECQNSNVILFCDMCNLAVHQECYGVPYIPEGQWLCRRCLQSPSRAVDCVLCPNRGGAFKQTDDGRWAHVVCALWIPEVCFANTVFLEPIDSIGNIPPARWKLTCYVCKQRGAGACIQCHKVNCYTAFHVTCAQQAGLHMKIDTVKESSTANLNVSVRKTAFCDVHTPSDSENRASAGDSYGETLRKAQFKAAFRDKMRKARKILAEKRSAAPVISVPTIPPERVQEIASSIHISGRNQFVQRLIAYWTLKRHSRNGVPLLRRLQMSHSSRRPEVHANDEEDGDKAMDLMTQLRCMQRLRQDLERARLLCELVRKREKTKRELLRIREKEFELMVSPSQYVLQNLLNTLKEKDTGEIFAEPVDVNEVTDYLTVIKQPMDLSTMQRKIDLHQYPTLESFEKDFQLMISNCMTYNGEQTIYYKAAVKLREAAAPLFRQARKDLETIAPDLEGSKPLAVSSGIEANKTRDEPAKENVPEKVPEKPIVEMVDAYLADKNREKDPPDHQLSKLEDLLFNVQKILPQGQQRLKRVRLLKAEMAKIRRKVSLQASGRPAATRSTNSPLKNTRNRDNTKQYRDTNSEESSGSSSDGESSSSDSDSSEEASANEEANRKIKTRARVSAAAKQLKMDSFITRSVQPRSSTSTAAAPPKETTTSTDSEKNAIKNRFVAKVMKRVRAENNMTSTQDSEAEAETSSRGGELPTTPLKTAENSAAQGLSGSPSGVNRRTAVLFTKKAAAAFKKPESLSPASSSPPRRSIGRPRKTSESSSSLNTNAVSSVTSTSTNLFSMAVGLTEPPASKMTTRKRQKAAENAENAVKNLFTNTSANLLATPGLSSIPSLRVPPPLPNIESDSFKVYRTSRKDDVDEDDFTRKSTSSRSSVVSSSGSESSSDSGDESASSSASSDESSVSNEQNQVQQAKIPGNPPVVPSSEIPLQPLDLVWAKCRGFPWYPALIVDPKWPRSGYVHNGVPIPVPPDDVLTMKVSSQEPLFLVLFFDAKRKWLWLPRNKLEPLGVDPDCDKAKLMEAKKPAERKAVKKAYEEAILHQCRVSGQGVSLSEESSSEDSD